MTHCVSNVTLIRRRSIIEYAEICAHIISGYAEHERQLINAQDIVLNPFSISLLYKRLLSFEHNDVDDIQKGMLADYYIKQLSKEITALVNNIEEPRFFVVAIIKKEVD
jgi:hypothetical protein